MIQNVLWIYVESTLSWTIHIEQVTHKLSAACYTVISIKPFMSKETVKVVYCAYFYSITNPGLIFWGNSSHSANIFKMLRNIVKVVIECRRTDLCRDLFKNLKIMPLQSQYIVSFLLFVVNNRHKFKVKFGAHHINTRQKCNFHQLVLFLLMY
jgi:hypothetical protein